MEVKYILMRNNTERVFCLKVISLDCVDIFRFFYRNDEGVWSEKKEFCDPDLMDASEIRLNESEAKAFRQQIEKWIPDAFLIYEIPKYT